MKTENIQINDYVDYCALFPAVAGSIEVKPQQRTEQES